MNDIQKVAEERFPDMQTSAGTISLHKERRIFTAGAQWERSRHAWVSVKDRLPNDKDCECGEIEILCWNNNLETWNIVRCSLSGLEYDFYSYFRTPLPDNFPIE